MKPLFSWKLLIGCLAGFFVSSYSSAQLEYGRAIMDSLCSPRYDGRGYVNQGDNRAAEFLVREFEKLGVQTFKNQSYYQEYTLPVNTFSHRIELILDGYTLEPGAEFLVDAHSGSAQGEYDLVEVNSTNYLTEFGGELDLSKKGSSQTLYALNFTDIDDRKKRGEIKMLAYRAMRFFPVLWVERDKQMHTVGAPATNYPMFTVDSASYFTAKKVQLKANNRYYPKYKSRNVIGLIPGKKKRKYVVLCGHYDHLGRMGPDVYFPGANDNASGVAMILSMAKYFLEHPPKYSIAICLFSGEEAGLHGSRYFVNHPYFKLKKVKFVLNVDIMGGASKGITVVNATQHEDEFKRLEQINQEKDLLGLVKRRGPTQNSDHHYFVESGVPAFFIYSIGSVKNYHDIYDTAENTPLNEFDDVQQLLIDFISTL